MENTRVRPAVTFDYEQIPAGYYDRIAVEGRGVQKFWHRFKFEFLVDLMRADAARVFESSARSLRVVDFGCGPGTFLGLLSKAFPIEGLGIDIAQTQVEYAQKTYGGQSLKFLPASLNDSSVADAIRAADVVTLVEVIEHLPLKEIFDVLGKIRELQSPGSRLLITTPNYQSLWPLLEIAVNALSEVNYEEQHITKFNRRKLQELLGTAGYEQVQTGSFLHASPFAAGLVGEGMGQWIRKTETRLSRAGGPLLWAEATRPKE